MQPHAHISRVFDFGVPIDNAAAAAHATSPGLVNQPWTRAASAAQQQQHSRLCQDAVGTSVYNPVSNVFVSVGVICQCRGGWGNSDASLLHL